MALEQGSLSPRRNFQENVSHGDKTVTTSNELDLLFSPMFDERLNGSTKVVSKSSAVTAADAPNQRQQPTTPLNNHTTTAPTCQTPPITPSVISNENRNQEEPQAENDEVADDEFINIFSTPVQDKGRRRYKPTNNNLRTSSNTSRANQDNSLRINRSARYKNQGIGNVAGARETVGSTVAQKSGIQCYNCKEFRHVAREEAKIQLNAEQADWRDDTDDELEDQELEAHYIKHPEQSESVHDTYPIEKDAHNVIIDSLDMSYDREEINQNDDDNDLANERELLASLIEKLKCEIDESKNRNKFLETSNKVLIEKLKGEIEDFKNKNKILELSNNRFKEANNQLSEINNLLYTDFKKSEAELVRRNSVEYASKMEIECAQVRGDFLSYKMESQKLFNKYTQTINDLNQTISEMKNKLSTHQETISVLSQQKEAQIKLYKTREDKELDRVIALENQVKVLDNIVYKTGQSVQTMNMLNNKCQTSFAKPEFIKKAQRANPRLYDIGCYNDNIALMLAPESDEVIHLEKESRSKLSNLVRPFDYDKLNNIYDLFVPQREKSSEQRYFSERSRLSHTCVNNGNSKESFNKQTTLLEKRMDESIPTYSGDLDPFNQNTIEAKISPEIRRINAGLEQFHKCLNEEMVADLRYFNSFELEVDSLRFELETHTTQFLNKIDRISKEYYYDDHKNAIFGVYTELDEDLKAQLLDKGIVISELKKLIEKLKGKSVNTKFGKSSVIRQPNAFKSQRPSILGKPTTFSNSLERNDFLKSKSVTQNNVSNDFSKPVTAQTLPPNKKSILKNTNVLALGIPQLKSNLMGDRVMRNNSQGNKQEVEDQRRNVKLSKNKTSVTACNNSLNAKTLNVNFVSAMCDKCVLNDKHDMCVLNSVAKPLKKTVASESNQKPRNITKKLYERVSKTCSWWRSTVSNTPLSSNSFVARRDCPIYRRLWVKHMTRNLKLLINFVEKFLGTVKFGNDQIAPIFGYGDLVQGAVTIKRVYYVEGLNHNLFFVGQFYDADLEVAFRKSTCYIRDLKGNDLLTGSCGTDLYSITLKDTNCPNPICLMAKATSSQAWLWHRHLSHLNFDTINLLSKNDIVVGIPKLKFIKDHLCFSCKLGKAKRKSFHTKITPSSKRRLQLLHMDLCGPMRVASINGKRYVPSLHAYFAAEGILYQMLVARTPEQNGVVERRNRTLVEAARIILSAAKVPLFFCAEAIATTCFTQNHGENLNKMKEKGDACIFMGYSTKSRAYIVFIKRTRVIVETIHVISDELPLMASDNVSFDLAPEYKTVTTSNELDFLFSLMFDELLNGSSKVVSKSSAVSTADAPNQRQQLTTPLSTHTTPAPIYRGETSYRYVDSSNMHTFYQHHTFEHRWMKDHPLEQVIGNPSQSVRTRRQLDSDGEICMFALTVSRTEPKNIKEAMADSA
nr:retrovirus-related Pol polyprotein from transposon TNT 1-94 [Tanacetum cinerariifolium]